MTDEVSAAARFAAAAMEMAAAGDKVEVVETPDSGAVSDGSENGHDDVADAVVPSTVWPAVAKSGTDAGADAAADAVPAAVAASVWPAVAALPTHTAASDESVVAQESAASAFAKAAAEAAAAEAEAAALAAAAAEQNASTEEEAAAAVEPIAEAVEPVAVSAANEPVAEIATAATAFAEAATAADNNAAATAATATTIVAGGRTKATAPDLHDEQAFPSLGGPAGGRRNVAAWSTRAAKPTAQTTEVVDLALAQDGVSETVRAIMNATRTRIEVSHNRALGTSTYLIRGAADAVARAKRDVCARLSPRVKRVLQVPAAARALVVGARGRALQAIEQQTGTRINVGRTSSSGEDAQIDVTIEGGAGGVAAAEALVEAAVDKRTTKRTLRLDTLPVEAGALLAGSALAELQAAHPAVTIRLPAPGDADQTVRVAGEREAAQAAAQAVAAAAQQLLDAAERTTVTVDPAAHRFVVGENGATLRSIVAATGCSVRVPAPGSGSALVRVVGPAAGVERAVQMIRDAASAVAVARVDVAAAHEGYARPLVYAQRVLAYLQARGRLARVEAEHGVRVHVPSTAQLARATQPADAFVEVHARTKAQAEAAADAVRVLVRALPPWHFNGIDVEPHMLAKLAGPDGASFARLQAARSVLAMPPSPDAPRGTPAASLLVVYEGFNPAIDSIADAAARERATRALLRETLEEFRATLAAAGAEQEARVLHVPAVHQTELAAALSSLPDASAVAVRFGSLPNAPTSGRTMAKQPAEPLDADAVEVRGPVEAVARVADELQRRATAAAELAFTAEVHVPAASMAHVLGRGRETLRRLQTAHSVQATVADGRVRLQGREADVNAARAEIEKLAVSAADQTTETLHVPANMHRALIGPGGRYVRRVEQKYAVRVQFPRADDADSTLAADEVRVAGGRQGVESACAELRELAAYEAEHGHTVRVSVPAASLRHIVGRQGATIAALRDDTGARIDLPDATDSADDTPVEIVLVGTRAATKRAREAVDALVAEHRDQVSVSVTVPARHHRFLIGAGGARVRELVVEAGGDPERLSGAGACRVNFPRAGADADEVRLAGDRRVVDAVRARIEQLVAERERMVTEHVSVPAAQHAFIIGRGGARLKQLQDAHSVEIFFPRAGKNSSDADDVRIIGLPEQCAAARAALLALVREERRMVVPLHVHRRLGGRQSALWRRLRADLDVQADAGRVDKPPSAAPQSAGVPGEVVYRDPAADLAGLTAEWVLRGEPAQLDKAVALVDEQTAAAVPAEARVCVDPRHHRHVVGRQGANIVRIRDATGCAVDVPKKGSSSQWVRVEGDRDAIERALTMIAELVDERAE